MAIPLRTISALIITLALAAASPLAEANSTPVRLDRDPVFAITPLTDTPLIVESERLEFMVGSSAAEAIVTASYRIANPSRGSLTVPMIFPAVSEHEPLARPRITLDGKELTYELFLAGSASVNSYFADPVGFARQVDVGTILAALNEPIHAPQSFDPFQSATLYEVTLGGETRRQSTISFEIDPQKTRVLALHHQGYAGKSTPSGLGVTFSRYVDEMTLGETMTVLVIGEDDIKDLALSPGDTLARSTIRIEDFLRKHLQSVSDLQGGIHARNLDNLYSAVLRELDSAWQLGGPPFSAARSFDDVLSNVLHSSNISVFLFTAEFAAGSTGELTVSYPVRATIDRSASTDYVNTFAYILSPAANFADFGTLDIEILLNDHAPYILESSIPLETRGNGRYLASFTGLPEVDLVFSTYSKPQITAFDAMRANLSYPLLALSIGAGFLLIITATLMLVRKFTKA